MITLRKSAERGHSNRGWLDSYFSFSFADYYDPNHMGFRALRVINDDRIQPGQGFGPHGHRDMEIITYVLEGHLLHRDSMGERHILGPNEVQTMSAGTGIVHSEFNASQAEEVHSIQIWILPDREDVTPSYQQIAFSPEEKQGHLRLLAGPDKAATRIHQDARLYVTEVAPQQSVAHKIDTGRAAWVQVVRGNVVLNGRDLSEGDAAAMTDEPELTLTGAASMGGEVLLFDLR
ncbi:MAG TPA: pirin family protein [Terriglobia bacterium]|nr:pirin family protein [Terriglobia bacterium]